MSARKSPTVRRRRLAAELRRLRKEVGFTREQLAEQIGCAPVTITRIETAQSGARVGEVSLMLEAFGITGEQREALLQVAKDARKRGWWHPYTGAIPEWFQVYVGLEEEAATVRTYQSETIPGILQTEAYIRALILAEPTVPSDEEIERRVAVRMGRQQRLMEAGDAPSMWIVLNEAALRRKVGGAATMCEQLRGLMDASRLSDVTLQVLSFDVGAHPAMTHGGFQILGFPGLMDPDVVYVEYRLGSLYLEKPGEIGIYNLLFDHLRAQALGREESRTLIAEVVEEMS